MDDIYRRDVVDGDVVRVSVRSDGADMNRPAVGVMELAITADGQQVFFVFFLSGRIGLAAGCGASWVSHLYVHDRQTDTTACATVDPTGQGNNPYISEPAIFLTLLRGSTWIVRDRVSGPKTRSTHRSDRPHHPVEAIRGPVESGRGPIERSMCRSDRPHDPIEAIRGPAKSGP